MVGVLAAEDDERGTVEDGVLRRDHGGPRTHLLHQALIPSTHYMTAIYAAQMQQLSKKSMVFSFALEFELLATNKLGNCRWPY
jgi:hypothetical protein